MEVIESFIKGKYDDPNRCEDVLIITSNFIAVIDGATDKSGRTYQGLTSGAFAARCLGESVEKFPSDIDSAKAVQLLTNSLREAVEEVLGELPPDMPTASVVIYSRLRNQIWRVGDCAFKIGERADAPIKLIDYITSFARRAMIEIEILEGKEQAAFLLNDSGREFIMPLLKKSYLFANLDTDSPFAFGVINGFEVPDRFIEVIEVGQQKEIVLSSDGYPDLGLSLADAEKKLQEILQEDPLCIGTNTSTKGLSSAQISFDDRAYVRFRL